MANFVLVYRGGGGMAATPAEREKAMAAWGAWFGTLGDAVVDMGAPFGPAATISADGTTKDGGTSALSGYSIVSATDLASAQAHAKGCPVLDGGGSVEVYESLPM
jgi:hypothetical protein